MGSKIESWCDGCKDPKPGEYCDYKHWASITGIKDLNDLCPTCWKKILPLFNIKEEEEKIEAPTRKKFHKTEDAW